MTPREKTAYRLAIAHCLRSSIGKPGAATMAWPKKGRGDLIVTDGYGRRTIVASARIPVPALQRRMKDDAAVRELCERIRIELLRLGVSAIRLRISIPHLPNLRRAGIDAVGCGLAIEAMLAMAGGRGARPFNIRGCPGVLDAAERRGVRVMEAGGAMLPVTRDAIEDVIRRMEERMAAWGVPIGEDAWLVIYSDGDRPRLFVDLDSIRDAAPIPSRFSRVYLFDAMSRESARADLAGVVGRVVDARDVDAPPSTPRDRRPSNRPGAP